MARIGTVCPVDAIFYADDVPDGWTDYVKVNRDFFDGLGNPGGAAKVGKVSADPSFIAELPPQR